MACQVSCYLQVNDRKPRQTVPNPGMMSSSHGANPRLMSGFLFSCETLLRCSRNNLDSLLGMRDRGEHGNLIGCLMDVWQGLVTTTRHRILISVFERRLDQEVRAWGVFVLIRVLDKLPRSSVSIEIYICFILSGYLSFILVFCPSVFWFFIPASLTLCISVTW